MFSPAVSGIPGLTALETGPVLQVHSAIIQLQKSTMFKRFFMYVVAFDTVIFFCEYDRMPTICKTVFSMVRQSALSLLLSATVWKV
jgi:hypothetical protein